MLEILEYVNSDPAHHRDIEMEWASYDILNGLVIDKNREITRLGKLHLKAIAEKDKAIAKKDEALAKKDEALQKAYAEIAKLKQK